jgi:hypothetical protein
MAVLFDKNSNGTDSKFSKEIDALRTPALNNIADALMNYSRDKGKSILETRFLTRPSDNDLVLWYIISQIHRNHSSDIKNPRQDIDIANEILSKKIDSRWLLHNYYYQFRAQLMYLFNEEDLSRYDFNLDSLGFNNETEKAIFFLNIMEALTLGRFRVLHVMKNYKRVLEFSNKLPKFNGKEYYHYKGFDYDDFEWMDSDSLQSYNKRHIGEYYSILLIQLIAVGELRSKKAAREIYQNSILSEPRYFKFTENQDDLQKLYEDSK